jgi:hypothetical protein
VVAYGKLAIALALVLGVLVRTASVCGLVYMLALLFSSNYPGAHAAFWQYFWSGPGSFSSAPMFRHICIWQRRSSTCAATSQALPTGIRNPRAHGNLSLDSTHTLHLICLASLIMHKVDEGI